VVDGSRARGRADVEIVEGTIAAVGKVDAATAEVIDVSAWCWHRIHRRPYHFDAQVFWDPDSRVVVARRDHGGPGQHRIRCGAVREGDHDC